MKVKLMTYIIDDTKTPMVIMSDFNVLPNDQRLNPL